MSSVPSNLATLSPDLSSVSTTNALDSSLLQVDAGPNIAKIIRKERQKHQLDDDLSKFMSLAATSETKHQSISINNLFLTLISITTKSKLHHHPVNHEYFINIQYTSMLSDKNGLII